MWVNMEGENWAEREAGGIPQQTWSSTGPSVRGGTDNTFHRRSPRTATDWTEHLGGEQAPKTVGSGLSLLAAIRGQGRDARGWWKRRGPAGTCTVEMSVATPRGKAEWELPAQG